MQQRTAAGRHDRHFESMMSQQSWVSQSNNPAKFNQTWNDGDLGYFEEGHPNTNKKNKLSIDMYRFLAQLFKSVTLRWRNTAGIPFSAIMLSV